MYPYFLPSALRITRPTACTMSICKFLGLMKSTASRAGTFTPSVRQRAFERIRHSHGVERSSHSMRDLRSSALCCPSTCRVSHRSARARSASGRLSVARATRESQCASRRRCALRAAPTQTVPHNPQAMTTRTRVSFPCRPPPAGPKSLALRLAPPGRARFPLAAEPPLTLPGADARALVVLGPGHVVDALA